MPITLVYDADEAGQRAAAENGARALFILETWGIPRSEGPTAQALANAQQAHDTLSRRATTLAAAQPQGEPLLALSDTLEADLEDLGRYITDLHYAELQGADDDYLACVTADEYIETQRPHKPMEDVGRFDYAKAKQSADLVAFASRFTELKQRGRAWVGKCPLKAHDDSTASFHVYEEQGQWWCFGCSTGGDAIDLARNQGISFSAIDQR